MRKYRSSHIIHTNYKKHTKNTQKIHKKSITNKKNNDTLLEMTYHINLTIFRIFPDFF